MIGCFIKNRENYLRKCFGTVELETWGNIYPLVSAHRLSNNWTQQRIFKLRSDPILAVLKSATSLFK